MIWSAAPEYEEEKGNTAEEKKNEQGGGVGEEGTLHLFSSRYRVLGHPPVRSLGELATYPPHPIYILVHTYVDTGTLVYCVGCHGWKASQLDSSAPTKRRPKKRGEWLSGAGGGENPLQGRRR